MIKILSSNCGWSIYKIAQNQCINDKKYINQRLQVEMMRTDIELGTYRNALRGGGTGGSSFDVRGGSTQQPSVGYSLGTATQ